jgi:hypothetical protein
MNRDLGYKSGGLPDKGMGDNLMYIPISNMEAWANAGHESVSFNLAFK